MKQKHIIIVVALALVLGIGINAFAGSNDAGLRAWYGITASSEEINFSDGTTSNVQAQIDAIIAGTGTTLADGKILVGGGGAAASAAAVDMSGDATIINSGALTIGTGAVTSAKILNATILEEDIANDAVTASKVSINEQTLVVAANTIFNTMTVATGSVPMGLPYSLSSEIYNSIAFGIINTGTGDTYIINTALSRANDMEFKANFISP
jgi:hypothetical protein